MSSRGHCGKGELFSVCRITCVLRVVACRNPGRQIERQTFTTMSGNVIFGRRHAEKREVTVGKEICYVSRVTSVLRVVACLNPGRQIERQTFTLLSGNDIFFVGVQKTFSGCLKLIYNLRSPFETVSNRSWKCLEFGVPKLVLVVDSKYCRFESGPTLNPKPPKSCQKPWKHVRESRKRHRNGLGSVSES